MLGGALPLSSVLISGQTHNLVQILSATFSFVSFRFSLFLAIAIVFNVLPTFRTLLVSYEGALLCIVFNTIHSEWVSKTTHEEPGSNRRRQLQPKRILLLKFRTRFQPFFSHEIKSDERILTKNYAKNATHDERRWKMANDRCRKGALDGEWNANVTPKPEI